LVGQRGEKGGVGKKWMIDVGKRQRKALFRDEGKKKSKRKWNRKGEEGGGDVARVFSLSFEGGRPIVGGLT